MEVINRFAEEGKPFFLYYEKHLVHGSPVPNEEFVGKPVICPYGDFVLQLDHYISEIIDKLKEKGIFEETIFIFTSDNGASGIADLDALKEYGHNPSYIFKGIKGHIWEGGQLERTIISYPAMIQGSIAYNHEISLFDIDRVLQKH